MSILGKFKQQQGEVEKYSIDYTNWLDVDALELLTGAVASWTPVDPVGPPDPFLVDQVELDVTQTKVTFRVQGGIPDNSPYIIEITATANSSRVSKECVEMEVTEDCSNG